MGCRLNRIVVTMACWLMVVAISGGCGHSRPVGSVEGVVRYRGAVVPEGFVTLYSSAMGLGKEVAINPDGTYFADGLRYGPYQIVVNLPRVSRDYGGKAPPSLEPKNVANIPPKYRDLATSGFSCDVKSRRTELNLEME